MQRFNLDIIGVSYPTTLPKVYYWDFPTAYFQLMNRTKCEPSTLDFLPERTALAAGSGIATVKSAPFAKTFMLTARLVKHYKIPVKKLINKAQNSRLGFFQFTFYFYINYIYRNTPLFRDTGWKNRNAHHELNLEIIPHRVEPRVIHAGLNETEYLLNNPDVKESGINPTWHALMHGIYEKRTFGSQGRMWKTFKKLLGNGTLLSKNFPSTSVFMGKSLLSSMKFESGIGNFQYSYEYFWNYEPFCIHLGHGGKVNAASDIPKLLAIRSQIIDFSENWSGDGHDG
jgi:hypothetical protein